MHILGSCTLLLFHYLQLSQIHHSFTLVTICKSSLGCLVIAAGVGQPSALHFYSPQPQPVFALPQNYSCWQSRPLFMYFLISIGEDSIAYCYAATLSLEEYLEQIVQRYSGSGIFFGSLPYFCIYLGCLPINVCFLHTLCFFSEDYQSIVPQKHIIMFGDRFRRFNPI